MTFHLANSVDGSIRQATLLSDADRHALPDTAPSWLPRTDGQRLLYAGAIVSLHGEPGCGKSWLAIHAAASVAEDGGHALIVDLETSLGEVIERVDALGVSSEAQSRMLYAPCDGSFTDGDLWAVKDLLREFPRTLVVIDSMGEALAAASANPNHDDEVAQWIAQVGRPWAKAGATVLLVDHVAKAADGRGRWAIGSQRKLAAIDQAFGVEVRSPWSRGVSGSARLLVAKDRRGHVGPVGSVAAVARFDAGVGDTVTIGLEPEGSSSGEDTTPIPGTVRHVVDALRASGGRWASAVDAQRALGLSRGGASKALDRAVESEAICRAMDGNRCTYSLPTPTGDEGAAPADFDAEWIRGQLDSDF